jgi:hypothetical protein
MVLVKDEERTESDADTKAAKKKKQSQKEKGFRQKRSLKVRDLRKLFADSRQRDVHFNALLQFLFTDLLFGCVFLLFGF